ncbi:MAG: FMN-binding glutamate synthase family protein, partial [Pseudomonadota bacterium]|nr:FMN-binding glutamate synthase family protein [Pseudomonadota bacterium]
MNFPALRYWPLLLVTAGFFVSWIAYFADIWPLWPTLVFAAVMLLGIWDIYQTRHAVLRNYPILGHVRYFFEMIRPEIRQYLIEADNEEVPFSRDSRAIVYQRAKNVEDKRPFGTKMKVYESGYQWLTHSIQPKKIKDTDFRVLIGGPDCKKPY